MPLLDNQSSSAVRRGLLRKTLQTLADIIFSPHPIEARSKGGAAPQRFISAESMNP
ncbi:MAG: hypothetical protein JO095_10705 [Alphaproteobacteria bacterium]|nr:hypothetical protein [Alphaproteobacteria bacterium]